MARSNSILKNIGIVFVVILVAFGIGYYVLSGPRSASAPTDALPAPAAAPDSAAPVHTASVPAPHITPRTKNSDYTAPDAPRIRIAEGTTPTLTRRPADPDAPASAPPTLSPSSSDTAQAPTPLDTSTGTNTSSDTTSSATPNPSAPTPPNAPLIPPAPPASTPAAPADQDFEQAGGHGNAEAGQDGLPPGKAAFRVQTGSFAAQQNAHALADALRGRGYSTSTHAEQENGKTVYKVQIGAYRTRAAADKAAQDLQKSGYPAYSSPIGP